MRGCAVFQASIEQMLWPEKRKHDRAVGSTSRRSDLYDRPHDRAQLHQHAGGVCAGSAAAGIGRSCSRLLPSLFDADGGITIGPFPKGLPVNLLSNLQPLSESSESDRACCGTSSRCCSCWSISSCYLATVPADCDRRADGERRSASKMGPALLALNKCPDFEVNRGHYFGTGMVRRRTRAQRQRQAGADRVPEDVLAAAHNMPPPVAECDYVIVGSGAGGGTLAARLAEAGMRVVVLEAGGDPRDGAGLPEDYDVPAFHPLASENPAMRWDFFVQHYADETRQRRDCKLQPDGIFYPRAGTLGGCTAHNAMILMAPHDADWDGIAALTGDASWRAAEMRRYFQRLENCRYRPLWRPCRGSVSIRPGMAGTAGCPPNARCRGRCSRIVRLLARSPSPRMRCCMARRTCRVSSGDCCSSRAGPQRPALDATQRRWAVLHAAQQPIGTGGWARASGCWTSQRAIRIGCGSS